MADEQSTTTDDERSPERCIFTDKLLKASQRTPKAGKDDTEAKHISMFNRRAAAGQCSHQPCLGTREFPAEFALVDGPVPASELPADQRNRDLGWMLYDIAFDKDRLPMFYRPEMVEGVIDVEKFHPSEARR